MPLDLKNHVETILCEAVEISDPQERISYLDQACGGDAGLRQSVDQLVADHFRAGKFLEQPGKSLALTTDQSLSELSGSKIGRYKLLEQIGEGGMGVVYMADQVEPVKRRVALKIIKPGMDSRQVVARFEAERQALAMMDHPHIARVLDGGETASGRPYFVMELVRGLPITEYCDQARLTPRQRLELAVTVCQAVHHAHQKGIIHRDLKPSNVLVTMQDGVPVAKVIDFGIAKATSGHLTEKTLFTAFAQMVGTPLYMSPEQTDLSSQDVDTRSDVYSLGVLLYELLTGSTPFEKERLGKASYDEMRRIIREEEPPRPSQRLSTLKAEARSTVSQQRKLDERLISRHLQGELDWIVMRALEKDRTRRYGSAADLAQDVQRYLHNEPVEACPPSAVYRLKKYARRQRVLLLTSGLVATALIIGTGASIWQAIVATQAHGEAEEQRKLAEKNLKDARDAVNRYFTLVSESRLLDEPGLQPLRMELIKAAVVFYEKFAADRPDDPKTQLELAATYLRLGQVYWHVQLRQDSTEAMEKGLLIIERLLKIVPPESDSYVPLAGFWHGGRITTAELANQKPEDHNQAVSVYQKGTEVWEVLFAAHPKQPEFGADLSKFHHRLRDELASVGRISEAHQAIERLIQIREALVRDYPDNHEFRGELAFGYMAMGNIYLYTDVEKYRKYYQLAFQTIEKVNVPHLRELLARNRVEFGRRLFVQQLPEEAMRQLQEAVAIDKELIAESPHVVDYQVALGVALLALGELQNKTAKLDEAEKNFREALHIFESLTAKNPEDIHFLKYRENAVRLLTQLLQASGRAEEAVVACQHLLEIYDRWAAKTSNDAGQLAELNSGYARLGELLQRLANTNGAEKAFRKALSISEKLTAEFPSNDYYWRQYGHSHMRLAKLLAATGRPTEEEEAVQQALVIQERLMTENPGNEDYRGDLEETQSQSVLWKFDAPGFGPNHPDFKRTLSDLGVFCNAHPDRHFCLYAHALASLAAEDVERYRKDCTSMLAQFVDATNPEQVYFTLWTCALAPSALKDYSQAISLANRVGERDSYRNRDLTCLGALQLRTGQYEDALASLKSAANIEKSEGTSSAYIDYFRTMAEHHLQQAEDAQKSLAKANELAEQELKDAAHPPAWNRKMTLEVLRREATLLLESPGDAKQPKDAREPKPASKDSVQDSEPKPDNQDVKKKP